MGIGVLLSVECRNKQWRHKVPAPHIRAYNSNNVPSVNVHCETSCPVWSIAAC